MGSADLRWHFDALWNYIGWDNASTVQGEVKDASRINKEEFLDQFGGQIESFTYTGPSVATFVEAQFPCSRGVSGISYVVFERAEQGEQAGFDRVIRFLGSDKSPRPNKLGAYGYKFDVTHRAVF